MTVDTWVSLVTLVAALSGLYWALRREFRSELSALAGRTDSGFAQVDQRFAQVDQRFAQVDQRFAQIDQRLLQVDRRLDHLDQRIADLRLEMKADIQRLDDRVYALAIGLKPALEQASGE